MARWIPASAPPWKRRHPWKPGLLKGTMAESASPALSAWSNFYVMTGSSAAALTGLMFVVISLVTGRTRPSTHDGIATLSTPTVMHFAAALMVSAILVMPWRSVTPAGVVTAFIGLCGVTYIVRVMRRTRRLTEYTADLEDWIWYTILPLVAYGALSAAAMALPTAPGPALFTLAGAVLLLMFIGIRNAWDVVTYVTVVRR